MLWRTAPPATGRRVWLAVVTAALLCTDHRWGKASHHLIYRICDSGLLTAPQIDELAEWFLIETFEIEITLGAAPGVARSSTFHPAPAGPAPHRQACRRTSR